MSTIDRRTSRTVRETVHLAVPLMAVWGIGLTVMAAVASQPEHRAGELLMDPSFTVGARWYTGLVSNLGILAWTVAAAAALAGAWLCRLGGRVSAHRFLLLGGGVGAMLLADDLLQFHAILLPGELGIPKALGQAALGASAVWWAWSNRAEIRRTHVHLLLAAVAALAASYTVDTIIGPAPGQGWSIVEDGAKFLGVLAWATYFVVTAQEVSRSVFADALRTWPSDAVGDGLDPSTTAERVPASA